MSTKIPIVSVKILEKILFHLGFEVKRQSGSHVFYRHPDGRYTTLPHHGNQDLGRSLIRQILREINLTPEQFIELIQNFRSNFSFRYSVFEYFAYLKEYGKQPSFT